MEFSVRLFFGLGLVLAVAGCTAPQAGTGVVHTLAGDPRLPEMEIRAFYSELGWRTVKDIPFDGYVVVRASINDDHTLSDLRVYESYPDDSHNELAMTFAQHARLSGTTVGGRTKPNGEIYVVFYETNSSPHRALVFGREIGGAALTEGIARNRFLDVYSY